MGPGDGEPPRLPDDARRRLVTPGRTTGGKKEEEGKKDPSHFGGGRRRRSALSAALRRVCAEMRVVSFSQLSVHTHTAILFSLSTTARARPPPARDVRGGAARDAQPHN